MPELKAHNRFPAHTICRYCAETCARELHLETPELGGSRSRGSARSMSDPCSQPACAAGAVSAILTQFSHRIVKYVCREFAYFAADEELMRRSITIAIAVAMTSLLALVVWQVEVKATDTILQKPEYGITANSYLPIQRLRPAY